MTIFFFILFMAISFPVHAVVNPLSIVCPQSIEENSTIELKAYFTVDGVKTDVTNSVAWSENSMFASIIRTNTLFANEVDDHTMVTVQASHFHNNRTYIATKNVIIIDTDQVYLLRLDLNLFKGGNVVYNERKYGVNAVQVFSDGSTRSAIADTIFGVNNEEFSFDGNVLNTPSMVAGETINFAVTGKTSYDGIVRNALLNLVAQYKPVIVSITIYGPLTLRSGQTGYYTARAYYDDGSNKMITAMNGVSWSTDDPSIGYFTAPGTLKIANTIIGTNYLTVTITVSDDGRISTENYVVTVIP